MKLTICGPNLADQSRGDFHVHAAGFVDLQRGMLRHADKWTMEADSLTEVSDEVYPPEDFDCESGEFTGEFHVAPCASALPIR